MKKVNIEIEIPDGMQIEDPIVIGPTGKVLMTGNGVLLGECVYIGLVPAKPRTLYIELEEILDQKGWINMGQYYTHNNGQTPKIWLHGAIDMHKEHPTSVVWRVK